jgi:hypothetical protein
LLRPKFQPLGNTVLLAISHQPLLPEQSLIFYWSSTSLPVQSLACYWSSTTVTWAKPGLLLVIRPPTILYTPYATIIMGPAIQLILTLPLNIHNDTGKTL